MDIEVIREIDRCLQLAERLERQLQENEAGFRRSMSDPPALAYSAGAQSALAKCRQLKSALTGLRSSEQLLLSEEQ